jgi:AbrB family looped-hinge helix DNA binding protein
MTDQKLQSRVTKKGQVTVPARLRKQFHIEAGKSVTFERSSEGIVLKPAPDIIDAAGELSKFASSTEMIRDLIQSRKKPFR